MSNKAMLLAIFFAVAFFPGFLQAKFRFGNKASSLNFKTANSHLIVNEKVDEINGTIKLKDQSVGRIVGSEVLFSNGTLSVEAEADLNFTGTYDPIKDDELLLKDATTLEFSPGKEVNKRVKVPSGATATISGSPVLKKPIELEDATSTLRLALQSTFDQDLHLNGGKIILDDDFRMTAQRKIYGGGTIDVNFKSIQMPGGTFSTGPLEFLNARDVQTTFNFTLDYPLIYSTLGGITDIRGYSFTINFDPGGRVEVKNDHTLYWANSNFRHVGIDEYSGVFDIDATSTVVFQNCCWVLDSTYTHTCGTLTFRDNCTILTRGNSFDVSDAGYLRVEGAVLLYDHVGGAQNDPFTFTDQKSQKVLVDGGVIRSTSALRSNQTFYNVATTSSVDMILSPESYVFFVNETPASVKNATLDMNGATIYFPTAGTKMFNLDPNVKLTVSNAVLSGFNKDVVTYGDAGSSLTFGANTKIRLFDDVTLTALDKNWVFSGNGSISGSGSTMKWTGAHNIGVGAADTVNLRDLILEGVGPSGTDGHFDISATGTLVLQNCSISLDGDYTHSAGTIEFRDGCKIISHGYNFNVQGLAFVRVNGAALECESLSGEDKTPFTFTDKDSQRVFVNGGVIRSTMASTAEQSFDGTSVSSNADMRPTLESPITLTNDTPGSPKAVSFDLNGNAIIFPASGSNLLNLDPNVNLTITNAVVDDFNKDVISYGDANATVEFGDEAEVRIVRDTTLGGADKTWMFTGNSTLRGFGGTLTLDGSSKITLDGSKTLKIECLTIICKNADSLECLNANSKILLKNCSFIMEQPGWTFNLGSIDVEGFVEFCGGDPAAVDTDSTLSFGSAGDLTILSGATLKLGQNVKLEYKADPSGDAGVTYDTKRHLKMTDPTSTLELAGCTLHSTATGIALDYGRLIVSDASTLISDGLSGTEAEIGSDVDFYIYPSTSFSVTGTLSYKLSSFV